jgi:hypothetical protein
MGELGALFNPGMRHELAERQAKAARREEEGNARDGDLRIDLESGVAVINVVDPDAEEAAAESSGAGRTKTKLADDATADRQSTSYATADRESNSDATADRESNSDATADRATAQGAAGVDEEPTSAPEPAAAPTVKPRGKRGLSHSTR